MIKWRHSNLKFNYYRLPSFSIFQSDKKSIT
jgi:hypothetical protein